MNRSILKRVVSWSFVALVSGHALGMSPIRQLCVAIKDDRNGTVEYLLEYNSDLPNARLSSDDAKFLKQKCGGGIVVKKLLGDNITPLHYAALHGKDTSVQLLVEYGASIKAKSRKGLLPERYAQLTRKRSTIKLLQNLEKNPPAKKKTERRTPKRSKRPVVGRRAKSPLTPSHRPKTRSLVDCETDDSDCGTDIEESDSDSEDNK